MDPITTKFDPYQDSTAVLVRAKFSCDLTETGENKKMHSNRILNSIEIYLEWKAPDAFTLSQPWEGRAQRLPVRNIMLATAEPMQETLLLTYISYSKPMLNMGYG